MFVIVSGVCLSLFTELLDLPLPNKFGGKGSYKTADKEYKRIFIGDKDNDQAGY